MIRSENLDALNAALSDAQGEFEAVSKTATNPFFKSKYAALPDVVKAAAPILSQHGLSVWQGADVDDAGELLWTVVLHSSGQFLGSPARLLPIKSDPQAQGSAYSYQRRYQYMAALGLVADEDDDGNAASRAGNRQPIRTPKPSRPAGRSKPATQVTLPSGVSDGHSGPENGSEVVLPPVENVQAQEIVTDLTLEVIRRTIKESGKSDEDVAWYLLSVGVESLPANPSREDLKAGLATMTVDQALRLDALLTDGDKDESVPGSGEVE